MGNEIPGVWGERGPVPNTTLSMKMFLHLDRHCTSPHFCCWGSGNDARIVSQRSRWLWVGISASFHLSFGSLVFQPVVGGLNQPVIQVTLPSEINVAANWLTSLEVVIIEKSLVVIL